MFICVFGTDGVDQSDLVLNGGASTRSYLIYNIDREYDRDGQTQLGEIGVRYNKQYKNEFRLKTKFVSSCLRLTDWRHICFRPVHPCVCLSVCDVFLP